MSKKNFLSVASASHILLVMGKKKITITVVMDPVELGSLGGSARAANLSAEELSEASRHASNARWQAYYAAHPDKLRAKLERDARKGTLPRGRPPGKKKER
jgi:hypothetical protein